VLAFLKPDGSRNIGRFAANAWPPASPVRAVAPVAALLRKGPGMAGARAGRALRGRNGKIGAPRNKNEGRALPRQAVGARAVGAEAVGVLAVGAARFGAIALGAAALGALALGALAIGRLTIGRARVRHLRIDDLVVDRLHVLGRIDEAVETVPRGGTGRPRSRPRLTRPDARRLYCPPAGSVEAFTSLPAPC
jgi:hypothetical protein